MTKKQGSMDEVSRVSVKSKQVVSAKTNYIHAVTSDNTRAAYQSDIRHFLSLGFDLPTNPEVMCKYLKLSAETLNPRMILRRLTSIRKWHELKEEGGPTNNELVTKTMQGISRLHGKPKSQALALTIKDLDKTIKTRVDDGDEKRGKQQNCGMALFLEGSQRPAGY